MGKLYDKDGNLIPLCFRCTTYNDFPECDAYHWTRGGSPSHWVQMKAAKCRDFSFDNWWKVNNMDCDKPSDFQTYKEPPVKGKQNTLKGSKWGD